jgi:uncharacterized ferritin-like protein (DUF455 family)
MSAFDAALFAEAPARDPRFRVVETWSEMENIYDDDGRMKTEFLHRQMHEEVNGLEIAARNITDFPEVDWDLRMAIARQCSDEARHVDMFKTAYEARGGTIGAFPVLCFEYRIVMRIESLAGRLALQNRSFEAAGIQAIGDGIKATREAGEHDLEALFDAQLADEIQHVRYANRWIEVLASRNPRIALEVVRAVSQGNEAFRIVAGDAAMNVDLDDHVRAELGLAQPAGR